MPTIDEDGLLGRSNGVMNDGSYDTESLKAAESQQATGEVDTSGMIDVDPLHITVIPNRQVHHTEEYEARMVIVEYDDMNNIIGVELL